MASKNLGAVIQRAISDGAFRRQLQSDPAAALRGFNLSPDEIAAVRSGDSSKLMSLGVDQRMSKAFTLGALSGTRSAMSGDVSGSATNVLAGGDTAATREGLVGDPTYGAREANTSGDLSGTRASVTTPQGDSYRAINDPDGAGGQRETLADPTSAGTHSTISEGQQDSYRAINDPDGTGGQRETISEGQQDSFRSINDPDGTGGQRETISEGQQDSYRSINDPDNDTVASRMQDANVGLPGSDVQQDPGFVDTHSAFTPSDSADVQRELLDGTHGTGDAIGNTGDTGINS